MSNSAGNGPPPKPWERAPASSGPAPFKPPSPGSTSDVVEASGTAKPGEIVNSSQRNPPATGSTLARPVPARPWEQNYGSSYGANAGYGSGLNTGYGSTMNTGYGSTMNTGYGSSYGTLGSVGGYGGSYGGGMYGSSMYRGGYGGGLYGGTGGMYGGTGGMYGGGVGSPMGGGYGMGMGGPYGEQDPNNPYGAPPSPPGFWISFLRVMQGVVTFFGRFAMLVDQNTQAFHMFMSALLQLFDRSGMLYGEIARFVLGVLGVRTKPRKIHPGGPEGHGQFINGPDGQQHIEGPKGAPAGSWDNVWGNDAAK